VLKLLFLSFGIAAVVVGVLMLGCVLGLVSLVTGVVVGLGVGLGGAVIGVTVGLFKLAAHLAGPLLVILGILVLVKIVDRV
jgi:hypothetical protein